MRLPSIALSAFVALIVIASERTLASELLIDCIHPHVADETPLNALFANSFDDGLVPGIGNIVIDPPGSPTLPGRLFMPSTPNGAAIIMMHGCSGLWSQHEPGTVAQAAIEKWGRKLAEDGYVALAIDSYTSRTPPGIDPVDFQSQCTDDAFEGAVDSYTTRVADMDIGIAWLRYRFGWTAARIGALGWSQGGQSVLVRSAETPRDNNLSRFGDPASERTAQLASVVFYPGCGTHLGFVEDGSIASSFWRPHRDLRLNHGGADPLHADCRDRVDIAWTSYNAIPESGHWLDYVEYPNAHHSFDGDVADWPNSRCAPDAPPSDVCAARDADIASLEFLGERLVAPTAP